jgi:hypothetical protein
MSGDFPVIHTQAEGSAPSELMVFGERNSGTNLAHTLLQRNLPAFADAPGDRIGRFGFRYGWKHGFPSMLAAPDHALAVCVFRHPEPWVQSMQARPWHAAPALKAMEFGAFIRAEWHAIVDEHNFGIEKGDPRALQELQWDRDPRTGQRFANILALRNAKTTGFLTLPARFANCLIVRHEDVARDPQGFVGRVATLFGLERAPDFAPVTERRGRVAEGPFSARDYPALSAEDHAHVWANLDRAQEARLGYTPSAI